MFRGRVNLTFLLGLGFMLLLGCSATSSPTSSPAPSVPNDSPTATRTSASSATRTSETAVQFCADADRRDALTISRALNWTLVKACSQSDLGTYQRWVLVGGQYANPIYAEIFGDALIERDEGFIVIKTSRTHSYDGQQRAVWGVAGWSESDTLESAAYVIDKGLPSENIRISR